MQMWKKQWREAPCSNNPKIKRHQEFETAKMKDIGKSVPIVSVLSARIFKSEMFIAEDRIISSQLSPIFCQIDLPHGAQICLSGFMEPLSKTNFQFTNFYSIEINALFAGKNGLVEGDKISFKIVNHIPKCRELCLQVENRDDWEIVSTNAEQIEMRMMDQIRLINATMIFPLWLNEFLYVFVRVEYVKPNVNCAMLYDGTTLILGLRNDAELKNGFTNRNLKIQTPPNQEHKKDYTQFD
uniref:Peroxisomal ATPase PEX1 N-terminal C-lobe domain-containing protein n=1 Tax=Romanomermis culicivorax TaxID=13658 RepID=A0A915JWH3_ROMCU